MNEIGFIGAGNMATAIIKGYAKKSRSDIFVYDIDEDKVEALQVFGAKGKFSIEDLVDSVKYLVLAVKPQNFPEVLSHIKGHVTDHHVIISIAAGITTDYIQRALEFDAKIVRVMPNTPLLLGYGASALSKSGETTQEEFEFCCHIFQSSGEIAVIDENQMNEIITINGSSPAYIYLLTQYFIDYAKQQGIDEKIALRLFSQTLIGAAKMMTDSGHTIEELITMVSSKGGTTIAGLNALREDHLDQTVQHACDACTKRAYELSK
jgi:pyrroline-5-carboxylate reductase